MTLRDELAEGCPGGRLFGESLATALTVHLFNRYGTRRRAGTPGTVVAAPGLPPSRLRRTLDHLNDRLFEDVSLIELAAVAAGPGAPPLSPNHFALLFRRSVGLPPHRYVLQQRVKRARNLLGSRPDLSLAEVALACGFYDQAHLTNAIKRALGVTPGEIRRATAP